MAIARMSHLRLIGLRSQENKILDVLTDCGIFEPRTTERTVGNREADASLARELKLKQGRVSFALDFIKQRRAAMAAMLKQNEAEVKAGAAQPLGYTLSKNKLAGRVTVTHADFSDVRAKEYDLLGVCEKLQQISFDIIDCKSRTNELNATARQYEPYTKLPVRFSELKRTGDIEISLFTGSAPIENELKELKCAYASLGLMYLVVCRAENTDRLYKAMSAAGYERCTFSDDCTAEQKLDAIRAEKADIERRVYELTKNALSYEKYYNELCILYDVIGLETERAEADEKFSKTDSTFILEGWVPEAAAKSTVDAIKGVAPNAFIQLLAPEEKDAPPTLVVNNKFVQPYEDITNSFNPPKFNEFDPNPIMSVFYFLFFGIMIGDAAYGLVLAVAGLVLGYSKRFDGGTKRLLLLIGWGGVSAIIWGIMFGGYFSIDFGAAKVALWFNPLDDPITLLILSMVMGVIQLTVGYIIRFVLLCKDKKIVDALCEPGPIILIFAAIVCVALALVVPGAPKALTTAGIVIGATGAGVIVVFGGRNKKGVFGKMVGGIPGLYGLINLLSDVLSYSRIFGLCLASCAIGLAFNTLGTIVFGIPGIGYIVGVVLLVPLHAFNLALGVISTYVHDSRLQFLEFYGKFYEGGGRLFAPMGSRTKHIRFA